jgi:hypothetical protein
MTASALARRGGLPCANTGSLPASADNVAAAVAPMKPRRLTAR